VKESDSLPMKRASVTVRMGGNYGVVACCSAVLAGRCYYDEEVTKAHEWLIRDLRLAHGADPDTVEEYNEEDDAYSRTSGSRGGSRPTSNGGLSSRPSSRPTSRGRASSPSSPLRPSSQPFSLLSTMAVDENSEQVLAILDNNNSNSNSGGGGGDRMHKTSSELALAEEEEPEEKAKKDAMKRQLELIEESIKLGHVAGFFQG
jgi:hypothetical protein